MLAISVGYWLNDAEGVLTISRRNAATSSLPVRLRDEDAWVLQDGEYGPC